MVDGIKFVSGVKDTDRRMFTMGSVSATGGVIGVPITGAVEVGKGAVGEADPCSRIGSGVEVSFSISVESFISALLFPVTVSFGSNLAKGRSKREDFGFSSD